MTDIVIKAENLGKMYTIGHQAEIGGYTSLRDVLMQNARTLWSKTKDLATGKAIIQGDMMEEVWALKDVSFEIRRGEAVGIIGRNGAGKSTLLKVLSRITEPSSGRVTIKGRVASLLEVGTGFHPELTGRENIYLNGTILGMTRVEIKRKFDEIVSFSGVEKYLDTPVKRYSTGMYVRLAFSVAAHLEPEILIVDEVLSVGDAEFQEKCLGKMENVAGEGRTVLFVSHNMAAIRSLCKRAVLLCNGQILADSKTDLVVSQYLSRTMIEKAVAKEDEIEACMEGVILRKNPHVRFIEIALLNKRGELCRSFSSDEPISIRVRFRCMKTIHNLRVILELTDEKDVCQLLSLNIDDPAMLIHYTRLHEGAYEYSCEIPPNLCGSKTFFLTVQLECPKIEHLVVTKILGFDVRFKGYNNSHVDYAASFRPQFKWHMQKIN